MDATTVDERPSLTGGKGEAGDRAFKVAALVAGLVVLAVLGGIVVSTIVKAWPAVSKEGVGYFTDESFNPTAGSYGIRAYVYGTLVVSLVAIVIAVPVSLGIALFVTEVAPRRLRVFITSVIDLLASVPSVVFGLWGFLVLAPKLNDLFGSIHDSVNGIPLLRNIFGPSGGGRSFMTAGMIVALMIIPIITSITREVFLTVPGNDKDGALALGATRWEMIRSVVLAHSSGGMVGAIMLGLGRAMGETIAIALLIGANPQIVANVFAAGEAMPSVIVRNLPESTGDFQAALIGLGVVLFAITISINILARVMVGRIDLRLRGTA